MTRRLDEHWVHQELQEGIRYFWAEVRGKKPKMVSWMQKGEVMGSEIFFPSDLPVVVRSQSWHLKLNQFTFQ